MLPLLSPRLILRRLASADLKTFLAYRNDPKVARYQSWESLRVTEATKFIKRQTTPGPLVPGQWLQIAIALRQTGRLIGDCALRVHPEDRRQATIGITLSRLNQGRGFATEALSTLFDCILLKMRFHRVQADTDPKNAAAWGLLERLGMRREAHLRQSLWFKGRWADEYIYAILRNEWRNRRERAR